MSPHTAETGNPSLRARQTPPSNSLDAERMLAKSAMPTEMMMNETAQQNTENPPVIRTLQDHVYELTSGIPPHRTDSGVGVTWGSRAYILKLFDYSKHSAKRAVKHILVCRDSLGRQTYWSVGTVWAVKHILVCRDSLGRQTHTGL
ncbi:cleavage stimulation factor subunit 1-like [Oncorhynchus kisutch]|uniref:cleavage stimulation factor subunit 1-like n=1 Tax=Oncorhynchus kisutch TaxID=8019 RepID=UPI00099FC896|nr:cleavage stimulation factor subunit 1-like [Oncorhynchus kisutch]